MMIMHYRSKKELKENVGQQLLYTETTFYEPEYQENSTFCGSNRPALTGNKGREFFATVTMKDGLIEQVK